MHKETFNFTHAEIQAHNQAHGELHHAYGVTMAQWAKVERMLFYWFSNLTRMQTEMARAVFYSARSFNGRSDMLRAVIPNATFSSEAQRKFIQEAMKKAWAYNGFRNCIVHGEPMMNVVNRGDRTKEIFYTITQGDAKGPQGDISIENLFTASDNFQVLSTLIHDAHPVMGEGRRSPEECLQQVTALPSQANSKSGPTPATPGQPPQSDGRVNKKEHRAAQAAKKPQNREEPQT